MQKSRLDDYPSLVPWYRHAKVAPPVPQSPEGFLFLACQLLSGVAGVDCPEDLGLSLASYLQNTSDPADALQEVKDLFASRDADLMDMISEFGEMAIRDGEADRFGDSLQVAADLTGDLSLRFLCAWTALNVGKLAECIVQCQKAGTDFAAINTLMGQACLEDGQAHRAIKALELAVQQSPDEVMAWFQLAKAYHVLDQHDPAWAALLRCQRLVPQSSEVGLFMAMVASSDQRHGAVKAQLAWDALYPSLGAHAANAQVVLYLIRLAVLLDCESKILEVIQAAKWDQVICDRNFAADFATILRRLEELGRMGTARDLLVAATVDLSRTA